VVETDLETPVEPAFSHFFDFPFDPFQLEAMAEIRAGRSVMVAAPTSAGKTVVAEYALWKAMQDGTRAIYTTPIKALSNQKRRDLEAMFPRQVGLLTGDRSENPEAPIVVMTTEVLRNMLVDDALSLDHVSVVVFDEVHYLADPERGTVWEEAIITCPPHVRLVCLSATIANAEEIAAWIGETHREIALIRHDERPVPLDHYYFTQDTLHLIRDAQGRRRAMFARERKMAPPHPGHVIKALDEAALLPAIWFAFSRQAVEDAAAACARSAPQPTKRQQARIESEIAWTLDTLPREDQRLPQLSLLISLLRRGVGFHHAGLLPPLKELVERLFTANLLSVVCATDTLAVGINMPARTVVISSLQRPLGGTLTPNEFSQLIGRAGRRGIDERGAVVMLPGRSYIFEDAYRDVCEPLEPILSAFRLRYSTLISAIEFGGDRLDGIIRSSLRQFQLKARARQSAHEAEELRQELAFVDEDQEMMAYLALQMELSSAEKEQKRAKNARNKSPHNPNLARRLARAREERDRLNRLVRRHPRHGEMLATENRDPSRMAQLRQLYRAEALVRQSEQECDQQALDTAEAVRAVLRRLGYLGKMGLTRKARGLREIVSAPGIVLSEMYGEGDFDDLSAPELAEVLSWFACDSNRRRDNFFRLPRHLAQLRRDAQSTFYKVAQIELQQGIELAQGPSEWFFGVALAWCRGDSVADITETIEMGEGDVVSQLNKTVDLLDQFESMLRVFGDVRLLHVAGEARRLLVRGLVAMVRTGTRLPDEQAAV
jgi:superfamily II RNA helicase